MWRWSSRPQCPWLARGGGRDVSQEGEPPRADISQQTGPEGMEWVSVLEGSLDKEGMVYVLEGLLEVNKDLGGM